MSCPDCELNPLRGAMYRWKHANVEIVGCRAHVAEIMAALSSVQAAERYGTPDERARWLAQQRKDLLHALDHRTERPIFAATRVSAIGRELETARQTPDERTLAAIARASIELLHLSMLLTAEYRPEQAAAIRTTVLGSWGGGHKPPAGGPA